MEGFVVSEGSDLLPPRTGGRTNLVDCYQALLLAALIETGLFQNLVKVTVNTQTPAVSVMATILMGQLLHLSNMILPPEYARNSHSLISLIASAMSFGAQAERSQASEVISCLDRVHQLKKEGPKPCSLYLRLILEQCGYFATHKNKELLKCISTEIDEATILSLIKDSGVTTTKEFTKWNWNLILSLLQHPSLKNSQLVEDSALGKFVKRLCNFYKPSNHLYSSIPYSEENSQRYSAVAQHLVKYLCRVEEGSSGFLFGLISDIVSELGQVTASKLTADVFSVPSVSHKLARDYFLFLGTVSFHKGTLLQQCRAYGPLLDICNYQNRSDLMRLMLGSMDFGHDTFARVVLSKILTSTERDMRLYATRYMRVLLRAKMPFFNSWGIELLVSQLYDLDKQVALVAVDILDEACEEENFLEALVLQKPALLHLGEKGASLLTRFISIKRGYTLISQVGILEDVLERWYKDINILYVFGVEERLAETLTSFKKTEEGKYVRRTILSHSSPKAFVPVHFYGQLAQQDEGCALLRKVGHIEKFEEIIRTPPCTQPVTQKETHLVKAAIWALGHIGSSPGGLQLLLERDIVAQLVDMAEGSPVLTIRGTCFYALCLIARTPNGANVLFDEGWTAMRRSSEEKWPLLFDPNAKEGEEGAIASPVMTSPVRTFPPLYGSFVFQDLPSAFRHHSPSIHKAVSESVISDARLSNQKVPSTDNHSSASSIASHGRSDTISEGLPGGSPGHKERLERRNRKFFVSLKELRRSPSLVRQQERCATPHSPLVNKQARPLSIGDVLDAGSTGNFSVPSSATSLTRQGSRPRPPHGTSFVGVALPLELCCMFEYNEEGFASSRPHVTPTPDFEQETLPHEPSQCLECLISSAGGGRGRGLLHSLRLTASFNSLSSETRPRAQTGDSVDSLGPESARLGYKGAGVQLIVGSVEGETDSGPSDKSSDASPSHIAVATLTKHEEEEENVEIDGRVTPMESSRSGRYSPLVRSKRLESEGEGEARGDEKEEGAEGASPPDVESGSFSPKKTVTVTVTSSSTSDGATKSSENGDSASVSSAATSRSAVIEEHSSEGRRRLHKAVLEVVFNLSSDVSIRKNTSGLNMICQRFPSVVQDVCLYSKVIDLLSSFEYNLHTRRFIESKFDSLSFSCLFAARPPLDDVTISEDDYYSSSSISSRTESFCSTDIHSLSEFDPTLRRRSSTGDVIRLRDNLHGSLTHQETREGSENRQLGANLNMNNSLDRTLTISETPDDRSTVFSSSGCTPDMEPSSPDKSGASGKASMDRLQVGKGNSPVSIVNVTFEL